MHYRSLSEEHALVPHITSTHILTLF